MNINALGGKFCKAGFLVLTMMLLSVNAAYGSEPAPKSAKQSPSQGEAKMDQGEWNRVIEAARKEGKLVIYASTIGDARMAISKAFTDKYGISIEFVQGRGAELVQRLSTERSAWIYQVDVGFQGL